MTSLLALLELIVVIAGIYAALIGIPVALFWLIRMLVA